MENADIPIQRPYRSHKIRACDYCRRRKQRCSVQVMGQPCDLCKGQNIICSYQYNTANESRKSIRKRPYDTTARDADTFRASSSNPRSLNLRAEEVSRKETDTSPHVVGPIASKDAQILEKFMSPGLVQDGQPTTENPYNVYSADPKMPVLYTQVERNNLGLIKPIEPGKKQKEIMEQILGRCARPLLDV